MLDTIETGEKPILSHEELTVRLGRQPYMQSVHPGSRIGLRRAGRSRGGTQQGPDIPQPSPEQQETEWATGTKVRGPEARSELLKDPARSPKSRE